jgi:hypothetical protein
MDYKFLLIFFGLSMVNVVFATIKSLVTINGSPAVASLVSGGYFAFYNIVMQYTVADFPMWQKCLITFVCNVVGVYCVKFGEKKSRKDKLWKIEVTIPAGQAPKMIEECCCQDLDYNYVDINKYYLFNFYCPTQKESEAVKKLLKSYDAKYFVTESKNL